MISWNLEFCLFLVHEAFTCNQQMALAPFVTLDHFYDDFFF